MAEIHESGENYLETILILSEGKDNVRAVDISNYSGFSKPSISRALGILKDRGFITVGKNGSILLTEAGENHAKRIYERHKMLTELLIGLGVNREIATEDACKMEHDLSDETFDALKKHFGLD